jgi:hypothetical protein
MRRVHTQELVELLIADKVNGSWRQDSADLANSWKVGLSSCGSQLTIIPFYKRGKSIGKIPRRLEGAEIFAVLSSPSHVARLLRFLFSVDSFCCGDDAIGF